MGILNSAKAEPTDPLRGTFNDIVDIVGFPRPEDAIGTPADVTHQIGFPTVRDAIPMPADIGARLLKGLKTGRMFGANGPGLPGLPAPPDMTRFFPPLPGESSRDANEGEAEVTDHPVGSFFSQRRRY